MLTKPQSVRLCLLLFLTYSSSSLCLGIACIALSFVDAHGQPVQLPPQDCASSQRSENWTSSFYPEHFDELTAVAKLDSVPVSSGTDKLA